ncbi:hypothetical protein F4818DRAFT_248500 [Hypoxylon cercidicola]|nr:hypothetical protein F4818DRAFT_248500 [Hypoxylon cercidicola]
MSCKDADPWVVETNFSSWKTRIKRPSLSGPCTCSRQYYTFSPRLLWFPRLGVCCLPCLPCLPLLAASPSPRERFYKDGIILSPLFHLSVTALMLAPYGAKTMVQSCWFIVCEVGRAGRVGGPPYNTNSLSYCNSHEGCVPVSAPIHTSGRVSIYERMSISSARSQVALCTS